MVLRRENCIATKNILIYLHGIVDYCLRYDYNGEMHLQGYMDYDLKGSMDNGKNTFSICFNLGFTMISYMRKMCNGLN